MGKGKRKLTIWETVVLRRKLRHRVYRRGHLGKRPSLLEWVARALAGRRS